LAEVDKLKADGFRYGRRIGHGRRFLFG
jgi:hypothetical protein